MLSNWWQMIKLQMKTKNYLNGDRMKSWDIDNLQLLAQKTFSKLERTPMIYIHGFCEWIAFVTHCPNGPN